MCLSCTLSMQAQPSVTGTALLLKTFAPNRSSFVSVAHKGCHFLRKWICIEMSVNKQHSAHVVKDTNNLEQTGAQKGGKRL